MASSMSSPTVPHGSTPQKVSLALSEAPIKEVTVYKGRAQITRTASFSPGIAVGLHEVEFKGIRSKFFVEESSLTVTGSGHCTILDFAFSDEGASPSAKTDDKRGEIQAAYEKKRQALEERHSRLASQHARKEILREMANRVANNAVSTFALHSGITPSCASGGNTTAAQGPMNIDEVSRVLDWWEKKVEEVDEECHRLTAEGVRSLNEMGKLASDHAASTEPKSNNNGRIKNGGGFSFSRVGTSLGKVVVTVDVEELHCPIELKVSYMTRGATWSPAYDLRVDNQNDSMSCTYYGRVSQRTNEDWNGVTLKLSTAEPSARSTPPSLETKTVSLRPPVVSIHESSFRETGGGRFHATTAFGAASPAPATSLFGAATPASTTGGLFGATPAAAGGFTFGATPAAAGAFTFGTTPSVPSPPPEAKAAVAHVEGGETNIGAVSFVVENPANIKCDGNSKKIPVGTLQLSTKVVHYIVPSKEPAAYIRAKATNSTDYLLLASDDASIVIGNSVVTKTFIPTVSPGESFQTYFGVDPAVKTQVAPIRKVTKKKGVFGNTDYVTHSHRTSISNTKKVPITCVVVEALPSSTDKIIKVTLQNPAPARVSEVAEAVNDKTLVNSALHMFLGDDDDDLVASSVSSAVPKDTKTGVIGVARGPTNHLAWVMKIAPQGCVSIPLEYTVEWPFDKEVVYEV